jgi:glycosyltransferase involved in cell wall biosynthesis
MKICFVCNEYPPLPHHGIGVLYKDLAEKLVQMGIEVWVIGYGNRSQPFEQNGVKVHWLYQPYTLKHSIKIGGYPYSIASLIRRHLLSIKVGQLVRSEGIDLVESHDFSGPLAFHPPSKLVVRLSGAVAVYRYAEGRPDEINPVDRHFERQQLQDGDAIIATSDYIGNLTNQALNLHLKYRVIYNGVDTDTFKPVPGTVNPKQVLYVGNILWRKGVFDLLRAAPYIVQKYPDVKIRIAGGVSGIHQRQLDSEIVDLSPEIRQRLEFIGKISYDDLPSLYNQADVFVFPSRVEAFGLTCIEAMACGRPVVATNLASGPELVENGISGLLADPTNPVDLAEKINILLGDPERAQKLGMNARQRVLEKFDLRDLGPRNLAFYQSILQGTS